MPVGEVRCSRLPGCARMSTLVAAAVLALALVVPGWLSALIGTEVPDDVWVRVLYLKGVRRKADRKALLQRPLPI